MAFYKTVILAQESTAKARQWEEAPTKLLPVSLLLTADSLRVVRTILATFLPRTPVRSSCPALPKQLLSSRRGL